MSEKLLLDKIIAEAELEEEDPSDADDGKNVTKALMSIVLRSGGLLFHDQFRNGFFAIKDNGAEIIKLHSKDFRIWLAHLGWNRLNKPISPNILQTVASTLEGKAVHEGPKHELHLRVANYDGAIWYDLGTGSVVKISKGGWEIVSDPPILFYRLSHQTPQVTPVAGGDIHEIFRFLPEPPDGNEKLLLVVWLVTALLPGFSHPILLVHGEKGSRKTTLFKLLRALIDPSVLETMTAQSDVAGFVQQASHNYFLPLDNLSPVHHNFSDILCRVVTGEGFSKRELYSDDDDIIYSFQRLVGVNGINMVLDKPDVLDRSLIINLIPPEKYETEEKLFGQFNDSKPRLLGALFDLMVMIMRVYDDMGEISGLERYRMASFVKWGCAAEAFGELSAKMTALELALATSSQMIASNTVAIAALEGRPVASAALSAGDNAQVVEAGSAVSAGEPSAGELAPPVDSTNKLCTETAKTVSGRTRMPISSKYSQLDILGQIFTAADCSEDRLAQIPWLEESPKGGLQYSFGLNVTLTAAPSAELLAQLLVLGFDCNTKSLFSVCRDWSANKVISVTDLKTLVPFVGEMSGDSSLR
jgi:hypothetical protein